MISSDNLPHPSLLHESIHAVSLIDLVNPNFTQQAGIVLCPIGPVRFNLPMILENFLELGGIFDVVGVDVQVDFRDGGSRGCGSTTTTAPGSGRLRASTTTTAPGSGRGRRTATSIR